MRQSAYHRSPLGPLGSYYLTMLTAGFSLPWAESDFWIITGAERRAVGTSGMNVSCSAASIGNAITCAAFDNARTTLFWLDLASGQLDPKATLSGRLINPLDDGAGWIAAHLNGTPVVLRADGSEGWRVRSEPDEWVMSIGASSAGVAAVIEARRDSILRIYEIPTSAGGHAAR